MRATLLTILSIAGPALALLHPPRATAGRACSPGAIVNTVAPTVSGPASVGSTLATSSGTWSSCQAPIVGYAYQWLRDGGSIGGATSRTYVVASGDGGHGFSARVAACNAEECSAPVVSSNGVAIPKPPASTSTPVATAAPQEEGSIATVTQGAWNGPVKSYRYQWLRNGASIAGATSPSYTLTTNDVDAYVTASVTATNDGGSTTIVSNALDVTQRTDWSVNYGGWQVDARCCALRAAKVGIRVPSALFTLSEHTGGAVRLVAQSCFLCDSTDGLIQVGVVQSPILIDDYGCFPDGTIFRRYWEVKKLGADEPFLCGYWDRPAFGSTSNYIVWRRPQGGEVTNSTTWGGFVQGELVVSYDVGWDAAGLVAIGGELTKEKTYCCTRPDAAMPATTFGYGTTEPWQRSPTAGGGSWAVVTQAHQRNTDGKWKLGRPPTPLDVSR